MEVVAAGAMKALLPKLGELLKDEYNLRKRVRKGIKSLETELTMMNAALRKVAKVPWDQLDEQVRIWAGKVRELSYDMEDAVDAFMVDRERELAANPKSMVKRFVKKTTKLLRKGKALRPIADAIKEAQGLAEELAALRQRYGLELHDSSSSGAAIDPRLTALYSEVTELVGIDDTRDELIRMLGVHDASMQQLKTISIVGFGGLGKTTIAKAVYEKIKEQFHCGAFVSVSRNPDITKIFKKMLYELDKVKFANINEATRDVPQLIDELREFLRDKRYFIIIDDIWDEKVWGYIKCAFSKNNLASRLITTTRNVNVSKACCSSNDDVSNEMKPLSVDDSKRLFYKRIFSQDNECPHELEDVSKDILKKCGGVPLAIITIASLLANKEIQTKDQWNTLCNSIGHGLTEGANVEDMQMILSFSYYDLPSHLKPCLLYLSIFPEDYEIRRDRLIWRWIAEGFVQHDKKGDIYSEFELGENYFNELINRSMIQLVEINAIDKAELGCRVHDMVLDLIYHLLSEENFVSVLDGLEQNTSSQRKVRRLSLQNSMTELTTPQTTTSMSQVRSFTIFSPAINLMPSLSCFHVIRVLDLEGCDLGQSCGHLNLGYVKFLFHLRYLGLRRTYIEKGVYMTRDTYVVRELPTEIENLQFLQTLDLRGAGIKELPPTVVRLRRLKCLHHGSKRLPDGFGNLTSLEELSPISTEHYADVVKELSQLTKLRVLVIEWAEMDERMATAFMGCLGNLTKLQSLDIYASGRGYLNLMREGWVPPPQLRIFRSKGSGGQFSTLPTWVNSSLKHISSLDIWIDKVGREDIQILGTLPALRSLFLKTSRSQEERAFVVGAGAFQCARECRFYGFVTVPSMFPQGAMPRVRFLEFCLRAWDFTSGDFDLRCLHMGNLPSLEHVEVSLWRGKVRFGQLMELEVALTRAADVHPNHPTISIRRMGKPSDKEREWQYHLMKTEMEYRMMMDPTFLPVYRPVFPRFAPTSASR